MIRNGDKKSVPMLKKLWKACFSDEDAYIDAFFEAMYEDENLLLVTEDGMLIGASFFLPGRIYVQEDTAFNSSGRWQDIRYVYALAVFEQYRGRGTAGKLLSHAYEHYQAPLIAEPAQESLVAGFYKPLGFSEAFYWNRQCIEIERETEISSVPQGAVQAAQIEPVKERMYLHDLHLEVRRADALEYNRIREARFLKHGFVSWPLRHTAFAVQEHSLNQGGALIAAGDGREDILLYYMEDGRPAVTETTLEAETAAEILHAWLPQPYSSVKMTLAPEQRTGPPAGVIYGMEPPFGYLNLSLD